MTPSSSTATARSPIRTSSSSARSAGAEAPSSSRTYTGRRSSGEGSSCSIQKVSTDRWRSSRNEPGDPSARWVGAVYPLDLIENTSGQHGAIALIVELAGACLGRSRDQASTRRSSSLSVSPALLSSGDDSRLLPMLLDRAPRAGAPDRLLARRVARRGRATASS